MATMGKQRAKLSEQIRAAVDASGMSRYRICKELGIAESTMSRFMSGQGGLSMEVLDALAALLGLTIKFPRRQRTERRTHGEHQS
jgi:transcriptional regulator with XRE-family HTH domain